MMKPNLEAAFAINRKIVNTVIGRDVKQALAGYHFPVFKAALPHRVGLAESAGPGLTVWETEPPGQAAQEVRAFATESKELLK
jgi:chromosome partitioning protein